jgi:DNA invertase Pin-like site-specific DNA recombinase
MTGLIYNRWSTDNDDGFSLMTQRRVNLEYAAARDIDVPDEYVFDEEFTGMKYERPKFDQVKRLIETKQVTDVIVFRVDRLARKDWMITYFFDEVVVPNSVRLHIAQQGRSIDPKTRDRLLLGIEANLAQDDREAQLRKLADGKATKRAQGILLGSGTIKYGYTKVGKKRDTHYERNEEQLAVVRRIADRLLAGARIVDIVDELNAANIQTPSQTRTTVWKRRTIYHLLHSEAYAGVFYESRHDGRSRKDHGSHAHFKPREEWVRFEFPELAILTREEFAEIQEIIATSHSRFAPGPTREYLLARRLKCGKCGSSWLCHTTVTPNHKKEYRYYVCNGTKKDRQHICSMQPLPVDRLDERVWKRLWRFLTDPKEQLATLKQAQAELVEEHRDTLAVLDKARATVAEYEAKLERYYNDYEGGLMSEKLYRSKKSDLDLRLKAAQNVISEYEHNVQGAITTDEAIDQTMRELDELRAWLSVTPLTFEKKRALLDAMKVKGVVHQDTLKLYVYRTHLGDVDFEELSTPSRGWPRRTGCAHSHALVHQPRSDRGRRRGAVTGRARRRIRRGCR